MGSKKKKATPLSATEIQDAVRAIDVIRQFIDWLRDDIEAPNHHAEIRDSIKLAKKWARDFHGKYFDRDRRRGIVFHWVIDVRADISEGRRPEPVVDDDGNCDALVREIQSDPSFPVAYKASGVAQLLAQSVLAKHKAVSFRKTGWLDYLTDAVNLAGDGSVTGMVLEAGVYAFEERERRVLGVDPRA